VETTLPPASDSSMASPALFQMGRWLLNEYGWPGVVYTRSSAPFASVVPAGNVYTWPASF
jgi:hypothetical protein